MATEEELGTSVAKGRYVVPPGVAVEELDGGKKKLSNECPEELRELLNKTDSVEIYDRLVETIVNEKTRSVFGRWRDQEIIKVLDKYRDDFADKSIRVCLCKRTSGSGSYRWLEFIDTSAVPEYVPQYDMSNLSGQVIKTCYTKLEFPNGVAVEELSRYGKARQKLKEQRPIYVEELMTKKNLLEEYDALVADIIAAGVGKWTKWNVEKVNEISKAHSPRFQAKGVEVFVSHKQEYISHGQYGGHVEMFRWIEFVDREEQPNYYPQRDVDTNPEDNCSLM